MYSILGDESGEAFGRNLLAMNYGISLKNAESRGSKKESSEWKTLLATSHSLMLKEPCGKSNFMAATLQSTCLTYINGSVWEKGYA